MEERKKKQNLTQVMAEIAVFSALGYILDLIASLIPNPLFVNGGSFGIALTAVFFVAYRRGTIAGVATGLIIGLLQLTAGFYVAPVADNAWKAFIQVALDYWLAYPVAGLAGLFRPLYKKAQTKGMQALYLSLGCFLGGMMKFLMHFLSGVIFWPSTTWTIGDSSFEIAGGSAVYSLLYNGAYMLPDTILSGLILVILAWRIPWILSPDHSLLSVKESENDLKEEK